MGWKKEGGEETGEIDTSIRQGDIHRDVYVCLCCVFPFRELLCGLAGSLWHLVLE